MAYCAHCGKQIRDEAKFCAHCGQPTSKAQFQAPPQAPPPPPPQWGYVSPGYAAPPPPPRRRSLAWVWGAVGAVVVIAVVCVLVFVVFGGGPNGADTPQEAVQAFFTALENQDTDAIFELLDPEIMEGELADQFGDEFRTAIRETIQGELFAQGKMKFSGLKMKTEMTGEDSAEVTVVEGKLTVKTKDGTEVTEDVTEADEPVTFQTVRRDGEWYLDPMSLDW